jgi:hypothetical protein
MHSWKSSEHPTDNIKVTSYAPDCCKMNSQALTDACSDTAGCQHAIKNLPPGPLRQQG